MSHHLRICSSSVVAFSCQPASSGRLSGPAGKTGRTAARLSAAIKFGLSAGVALAERLCIFTPFLWYRGCADRRSLDIERLKTGLGRTFHPQAAEVEVVVPQVPVVKRKVDGCGRSPRVVLPWASWSDTTRSAVPANLPCRDSPWRRKRHRSSVRSTAASSQLS